MTRQSQPTFKSLILAGLLGASALQGIGPASASNFAAAPGWLTALSSGETGPFKADRNAGAWLNGFALAFDAKCDVVAAAPYHALDALTNSMSGSDPEAGLWARRGHRDGTAFLAAEGCAADGAAATVRFAAASALAKVTESRRGANPIPAYFIRIDNKTGEAVTQLRLKPAGVAGAGQARLDGGRVIAAGAAQGFPIKTLNGCLYDVETTFAGGEVRRATAQDLCKGETLTLTAPEAGRGPRTDERRPGERRAFERLTIENRSQRRIDIVQVSPASERMWGPDLLGQVTIAPGASHHVEVPRSDACTYDVRIVYADRQVEDAHRVDLCRIERIASDGSRARPLPPQ